MCELGSLVTDRHRYFEKSLSFQRIVDSRERFEPDAVGGNTIQS